VPLRFYNTSKNEFYQRSVGQQGKWAEVDKVNQRFEDMFARFENKVANIEAKMKEVREKSKALERD